ncbi:hypothetical protein [Actinomadura decatromicini]|uniref:Uncharacterized protein n=1 Tax=Actinomadura decatromicini TaxID=2604572 RepID=A0A5D3FBU4_9ACTN|nr:hypothetical protein [Actinomadura decatromicini]TYK45220.1 hypothetical protein FXF68_31580 [Actinomadura decatromicini]
MLPAVIAQQLGQLGVDLDAAVRRLGELEATAVDAEATYKTKFSRIFRDSSGSVEDRKQQAVAECDSEWRQWSLAASAVHIQKEHIKALHARIDVGRTLASTARAEASLAGSGITP